MSVIMNAFIELYDIPDFHNWAIQLRRSPYTVFTIYLVTGVSDAQLLDYHERWLSRQIALDIIISGS